MTASPPAAEPRTRAGDRDRLLAWAGVALLCLSAILAAGIEALLVPLYAGSHLFPVTIALTLLTNVAFPLLARTLVPQLLALVLPFVCWLVTIIGFGIVPRPEGDVILPGGPPQWVSYAVILGGALVGTITVVSASPQSQLSARPPDDPQRRPATSNSTTSKSTTSRSTVPAKSVPAKRAPKRKR